MKPLIQPEQAEDSRALVLVATDKNCMYGRQLALGGLRFSNVMPEQICIL